MKKFKNFNNASSNLSAMSPGTDVRTGPASERQGGARGRDMLSLSMAPIPELIAALEDEKLEQSPSLKRRTKRLGRLVMREAVRLIRVGTRAEIADAALELSEALARPSAERLREVAPRAHRLMTSASDALGAATPPSSGGGEMTLLNPRSWKGKALKAVTMVNSAPGRAVPRAELRLQLEMEDSHLSHMLAELEGAGLIVRVRSGRSVTVHLGVVGRSEHVQAILPQEERASTAKAGTRLEQADPYVKVEYREQPRLGLSPRIDRDELVQAFLLPEIDEHLYEYDNKLGMEGPVVMPGAWNNTGTAKLLDRPAEVGVGSARLLKDTTPAKV
jgi:DNA-binding MarR family transcriptional regulator